jgi:transposase InsO family protein
LGSVELIIKKKIWASNCVFAWHWPDVLCQCSKFVQTTDSRHHLPVFDNVLNRQFEQPSANQTWVADITYIRVRNS